MPNPLEFFKNIFSKTGEVVADTAQEMLKARLEINVRPSISLPDLGGIDSAVVSGAKALGGVAGASLKNYKAPNKIDSSGLEEAAQTSVDLQQKILKNRISETEIKHTDKQPINMLSNIDTPKIKVKETAGEDFTAKKTQEDLKPAKILYGPREKTQKEIQKEKSYPKYIEDFSQAQLLYADKGIIKKAEQASRVRSKDTRVRLQSNTQPIKGYISKTENISTGNNNYIDLNNSSNYTGSDEFSFIRDYINNKPELDGEFQELFKRFEGIDLSNKAILDKLFKTITPEMKTVFKEAFKLYIKVAPVEHLAKLVGRKYTGFLNDCAREIIGKDAAGMLDISHTEINNADYIKNAFKFKNYKDARLDKYHKYLEKKLISQFKIKGYNITEVQGYYFSSNSEASKRLIQNSYFREFLKANRKAILSGKKEFTIEFKTGDMYYAHHLADIFVEGFDKKGSLIVVLGDTNDYNIGDPSKLVQAGGIAMKKGELIPLFVFKEALVPKEELDKIWK